MASQKSSATKIALYSFLIGLLTLVVIIISGPKPPKVNLDADYAPKLNSIQEAEKWLFQHEYQDTLIWPTARAEIQWADSSMQKTEYALVYIHGFSASKKEGFPTYNEVAKHFGMNTYLARLHQHGVYGDDAFQTLSADSLIAEAKRAIDIGHLLGEKVILMGTSTGGTLALTMAAQRDDIEAVILMSPLVDFFDSRSFVFTWPWGENIMKAINGGNYLTNIKEDPRAADIWYPKYHIHGVPVLGSLVNATMHDEIFAKIDEPLFLGYYYKNEKEQDPTVSVKAMLNMFDKLGTSAPNKEKKAYPEAGAHVIGSDITSKSVDSVVSDIERFIDTHVMN